jgi:capsid protein
MASYKFQCKTKNKALNESVELLFKRWKRRENCDITGEFSFDEMLQLIELHRTTDGDILIVKHGDLSLQLIEGDRVRNPDNVGIDQDWYHGLHRNDYGRITEYAVSKRQETGGFKHERIIPREHAWLVSYRRRADQRRGVTPLAPAINQMYGLYESFDFSLAKERLMQMLGFVTMRGDPDEPVTSKKTQQQIEDDEDQFHAELVDAFGPEIAHIALRVGEDLKVVESDQPSQNTQAFWEMQIRLILLSLHIPYSFFDGSKQTFYGAEGELNQYLDSCTSRQIPVLEWLHELSCWLVEAWVDDGYITLPDDLSLQELFDSLKWSNAGMPIFTMFRLIKETNLAISCGSTSPIKNAQLYGMDLEENFKETAEAIKIARENGIKAAYDIQPSDNVSYTFGGAK